MLERTAELSPCERYRYCLGRHWNKSAPACLFIMLNPSTADHIIDDRTIVKCKTYAAKWGYGSLLVGNLFALRSTDPKALRQAVSAGEDPVGPENNGHIVALLAQASLVVCAWGVNGTLLERDQEVVEMLQGRGQALTLTKDGHPNHQLYLRSDLKPVPFP